MEALLPLLLIFGIMMLPLMFMSSRQRKAQRQHQEMVSQLGVGDEVRTHSGFYGLIVEEFEDVVILESESGAQTKWARQAIAAKVDPVGDAAAELLEDDEEAAAGEDDIPGVTVRDEDTGTDDDRRER